MNDMAGGSSHCKHHKKSDAHMEDQISKLPDEVLVQILSLLTIEEAGRSSVLSSRWQNLWKLTTRLNFYVSPIERVRGALPNSNGEALRTKYVTLVNQVLTLHEGCSLDEFVVTYPLDASYNDVIDEWMKLMILKRAKRIEIYFFRPRHDADYYSLSQECLDFFKSESNLSNFKCLTSLTLGAVNIDEELIEYLLSKCPHLETLSISYSQKLFRLRVVGPSLPLRSLNISAECLESIELSTPNLVTLSYYGKPISFILGRNPLLSELSFGEEIGDNVVTSCLPLFSSYFSQIETLTLFFRLKKNLKLPEVSGLRNLKHLKCEIHTYFDRSLAGLAKFIRAAPCLLKLTVKWCVYDPLFDAPPIGYPPSIQLHAGLKEVEIIGYSGCMSQLQLVRYLLKSAFNLEKMVLDQSYPTDYDYLSPKETKEVAKLVAEQAEAMRGSLPPRAELIIL